MPVYKITTPNSNETETLWAADEEEAVRDAGYWHGKATAVPFDETFIPLSDAYQVGDWIVSRVAIIHKRFARIMEPALGEAKPEKLAPVLAWLETAVPVAAEPVMIDQVGWRYDVHLKAGDRQMAIPMFSWLAAFECGLDCCAADVEPARPEALREKDLVLLAEGFDVVGVVSGLIFAGSHRANVVWRDTAIAVAA